MNESGKQVRQEEQGPGRLNERTTSAVVRGVFWFTWLTAKYREAANLARRTEGQRAEWN